MSSEQILRCRTIDFDLNFVIVPKHAMRHRGAWNRIISRTTIAAAVYNPSPLPTITQWHVITQASSDTEKKVLFSKYLIMVKFKLTKSLKFYLTHLETCNESAMIFIA